MCKYKSVSVCVVVGDKGFQSKLHCKKLFYGFLSYQGEES